MNRRVQVYTVVFSAAGRCEEAARSLPLTRLHTWPSLLLRGSHRLAGEHHQPAVVILRPLHGIGHAMRLHSLLSKGHGDRAAVVQVHLQGRAGTPPGQHTHTLGHLTLQQAALQRWRRRVPGRRSCWDRTSVVVLPDATAASSSAFLATLRNTSSRLRAAREAASFAPVSPQLPAGCAPADHGLPASTGPPLPRRPINTPSCCGSQAGGRAGGQAGRRRARARRQARVARGLTWSG